MRVDGDKVFVTPFGYLKTRFDSVRLRPKIGSCTRPLFVTGLNLAFRDGFLQSCHL